MTRTIEPPEADIREPALKRRARTVGARLAAEPEAGSAFGRCLLLKVITPPQYRAGLQLEALTQLYAIALGLPAGHARALDVTHIPGGPSSGEGFPPGKVVRLTQRYDRARATMIRAGIDAYRVTCSVVLQGHAPTTDQVKMLRDGLDALRAHFEAGGNSKGAVRRKPNKVLSWSDGAGIVRIDERFWE